MPYRPVFLYADEGVGAHSLRALRKALKKALPERDIRPVYASTLPKELEETPPAALFFPGGRDLPYCAKLAGTPNHAIRRYVEQGGVYVGICAGAYYASGSISFEAGTPLAVEGERELAFFPGTAWGTLYQQGLFQYGTESGARSSEIIWEEGKCSAYYNGGCTFLEAETTPGVSVLGRYADLPDQPAALIQCQVNRGMALLTGVHPEIAGAPLFQLILHRAGLV